jgi:prepilin-type N-terminal cleavage/methylation domain-containing protein
MASEVGRRARSQAGFTLVEILVVLLILGLLASIAIPAFFSQRNKARDAEAKVMVRTAETAMETFATDRGGSYSGVSPNALLAIEPSLRNVPSGDLTAQAMGASGKYRVAVVSGTGTQFTIRREADDSVTYACDNPGAGACPSSGLWN